MNNLTQKSLPNAGDLWHDYNHLWKVISALLLLHISHHHKLLLFERKFHFFTQFYCSLTICWLLWEFFIDLFYCMHMKIIKCWAKEEEEANSFNFLHHFDFLNNRAKAYENQKLSHSQWALLKDFAIIFLLKKERKKEVKKRLIENKFVLPKKELSMIATNHRKFISLWGTR